MDQTRISEKSEAPHYCSTVTTATTQMEPNIDKNDSKMENNGELGLDLISQLPCEVLICIISSLSTYEAVRTSILSKRWQHLWKYTSDLNFDVTLMRKATSPLYYREVVYEILSHHFGDLTSCKFKHFALSSQDVVESIQVVVRQNKRLSSLIVESVNNNCMVRQNKRLSSLSVNNNCMVKASFKPSMFSNLSSLELCNYELNDSFSSALGSFEKLKILKLSKVYIREHTINFVLMRSGALEKFSLIQSRGFRNLKIQNPSLKYLELVWLTFLEIDVYVEGLQVVRLDSLICSSKKSLKLYSKDLKAFYYGCNAFYYGCNRMGKSFIIRNGFSIPMKTSDILENCSDLLQGPHSFNIFQNLLTLSIELNLNDIREAMALSDVLKSCTCLSTLEITIPEMKKAPNNDNCSLPFDKTMFWDRHTCDCISYQLRSATVRGFTGKDLEVEFVKLLITKSWFIKKICVVCDSYSSTMIEAEALLLSLEKCSFLLSLQLESPPRKRHHRGRMRLGLRHSGRRL